MCLKEMLANADDVRATHFTILLDKSQYPTQGLLHDDMQDMQKPALLVGNDAVFSEQDFIGYTRKIGNSFKENDSQTAGQFGRGGMTAYSLSDTIQLVTGNDIMMLDPHRTACPTSNHPFVATLWTQQACTMWTFSSRLQCNLSLSLQPQQPVQHYPPCPLTLTTQARCSG